MTVAAQQPDQAAPQSPVSGAPTRISPVTLLVMLLSTIANVEGSLAKTGGPVFSIALVGGMLATILGAWGTIQIVNRWR